MDTVRVNGTEISGQAIAAEMQYHPAPSREAAWHEAATALTIRQLLLQEAVRLGIEPNPDDATEAAAEESTIQSLLALEVSIPEPDEETCRRYWAANKARFRTPDLYEAAHILFAAAAGDETARQAAKAVAVETLGLLKADPRRFAVLAQERSACPSGAAGGLLGQQTRGDLVPEIEAFVMAIEEGQICPVPIATRYGYHVLRLDRRVEGAVLPFDTAAPMVAHHLTTQSWQRAVSQYLKLLAGRASIEGLAVDGAGTSLVQ